MTEQLYFDDSMCLEFQAEVTEVNPESSGRVTVILPRTYFYPTSGGQDHDTGKIGDAHVLDVFKERENKIIHVLDREILPGMYPASIDKARRWQNMQAHTAQHVLSRAFELDLNLETLSANINSVGSSTIDLGANSILDRDLHQVEMVANSLIFENRRVKSYSIMEKDIPKIPFRRPPKVTGKIRVVEVDGFDYSACGGTHCPQTGMVGLIKILKFETQNHKLRIHFVAGTQALRVFQSVYETTMCISRVMDSNLDELALSVQRQVEKMHHLEIDLEACKSKFLTIEAIQLAESASAIGKLKLITKLYSEKSPEELRKLAATIRSENGFLVILAALNRRKLSLIVGCSQDIQLDARKILHLHLEKYHGRGGGDQYLAQGGCNLSDEFADNLYLDTINIVSKMNPV